MIAAAILGVKFYPALLENLCSIGTDYLKIVLSKLTKLNFISPVSNMSFEFKSNKIWSLILANVKQTNEYDKDEGLRFRNFVYILYAALGFSKNRTNRIFPREP